MALNDFAKTNKNYNKENPKIELSHTSGLPLDRLMVLHYLSYDSGLISELRELGSIIKSERL